MYMTIYDQGFWIYGWELTSLSQNLRYTLISDKSLSCHYSLCLHLIIWCWLTLLQIKPSHPVKDSEIQCWCSSMDKSLQLNKPLKLKKNIKEVLYIHSTIMESVIWLHFLRLVGNLKTYPHMNTQTHFWFFYFKENSVKVFLSLPFSSLEFY